MDELASRSRDKLLMFRLMELKDVLGRIGMTKQGKKQVLKDRIMNLLAPPDPQGFKSNGGAGKIIAVGREEVAKIIDDIFRKMKGCDADDLVAKVHMPKSVGSVDEDEYAETGIIEAKTRCPCGSSMDRDIMIQCDNNKCKVWQHLTCVVIPEKIGEGVQAEVPTLFYCEACRINRADPFCVTVSQPVLPTKLTTSFVSGEGSSPLQNIEKTFILTRSDRELLQSPGCDLQVWCILLNDMVMFRMHWPQYSDLRVNGVSVRVTDRPGPQLLGASGRDDGPGVLSLVPAETEGETFDKGLARVQRCIGGVDSLGNVDDSDSGLEVVAESITVNLKCPMSGLRMNVAGRFKSCEHMGCFDLQTFIELNERTRKWQCPICLKNYSLEDIVIDQYFSRIASAMKGYPEDVTEIEVKPDGSWCPKHEVEEKHQEKWHLQEGSFSISNGDAKMKFKLSNQVKQEGHISEARMPLKIGTKRNHDGHWELHGAKDSTKHSNAFNKNKKQELTKLPQCSSPTKINRNHEHTSINQETSENLYILVGDDSDSDSTSLGPVCSSSSVVKNTDSQVQKDSEVIVLSDSEEEVENKLNIGSSAASAFASSDNPAQDGFHRINSSEDLPEEVLISHNFISSVPFGSSTLSSVTCIANGPVELFGLDAFKIDPPNLSDNTQNMDTDAPDSMAISQQISARSTSLTRYNAALWEQSNKSLVPRIPYDASSPFSPQNYFSTDLNDTYIENLSGIDSGEAFLQSFLLPEPAQTSVQGDENGPTVASDTLQTNWISLSLARREISGIYTHKTYITNRQQAADQRNGL
ncbi:E3 SUMO-protein ligase SIZ1 isoform X2 [Cryptomeria japonica]|uniref:E3 SUMO-protein ligase SIZ1 isoform X2 n=1 Tax=Cryptomeria japonica TaxID=3369 RepID=UPI0027DA611A|nr:E3 SUMO-protein ligase SIZ1 isoform X2 [Cryptomeria japonica]